MYHFCCCAQYFVDFELSFAVFVPSYSACVPTVFSCTSLLHRNESRSPCLVAGAAFATHLIGESELRRLPKEVCVTVAVPLGLSKEIAKRSLCNSRCAIGIVKKRLSKEVCVIVAVPLGFGMLRISKKAILHTLCHWYSMQTSS